MPGHVTVQVPVRVTAADVRHRRPLRWRAASFELELSGRHGPVRWGRWLQADRRVGRWRRGDAEGRLVIDVVPASRWMVLVTVGVDQPAGWWRARVRHADVRAIATGLRDHLESGARSEASEVAHVPASVPASVDRVARVPGELAPEVSGILPA